MPLWVHQRPCEAISTAGLNSFVLEELAQKKRNQLFFNLGELIKHHVQIMRGKCSESRDARALIKVNLCGVALYFSSAAECSFCLKRTQPPPDQHQSNHSERRSGKRVGLNASRAEKSLTHSHMATIKKQVGVVSGLRRGCRWRPETDEVKMLFSNNIFCSLYFINLLPRLRSRIQ